MEAVLVLAHGSKRQETEEILNSLIGKVKIKTGNERVYPAYLQFSEQDLEKTVSELYEQGVRIIKMIPLFIFNGVHVTQDIPEEIERIRSKYNDLNIVYSKHIGDDDKLADIIVDRINS